MKYPIGIQTFEQIIMDGYIYVDKTDLIYSLVTRGKIYFLSRPRRFGKSLLLSTLENYFQGRKDLFEGLKISKLENNWLAYPVFHIDFNGVNFNQPRALEAKLEGYISSWEKIYGINPGIDFNLGSRFENVLRAAAQKYQRGAVVLVDEYDKPLLDVLDRDEKLLNHNRDILKAFYSTFKLADRYLQFVFLTGVTRFSQVSVFSGFNSPKDITINEEYEAICGITEEELQLYFQTSIQEMAKREECTANEMKQILKRQYDGYHFSERMKDIYNPFSILNAFDSKRPYDFWFSSGTPEYLIRLLNLSNENINEITGKYYDSSNFMDYKAHAENPLPMLFQSGYLTIKDYDKRRNRFMLDFPNNEVKSGLLTLIASNYLKTNEDTRNIAQEMVFSLEDGNLEKFHGILTAFLAEIPYTMRRKENEREKERYFHYTFYLILRLMSVYTVYTEKEQSQGRVDCIIETPKFVYIFEFKLDSTAKEALQQIESKGYANPYKNDERKLYKVGISFSSETGTIKDWDVQSSDEK
ncbi:AAA family ATPase [uncultured Bacteroides sp.]|uniref:ATP-binding protein n=1 Tax=uncultured Bacteroides sp. TaxID=162156 RepID=UPI0027D9B391|nr:AAA family ATPase [uncultured Bacteroides sp.]